MSDKADALQEPFQDEIQQFTSDLFRGEDMGVVLRAQIRIEAELIKFAEKSLADPKALRELHLDFYGLVTLCVALGLDSDYAPPLRALGKLRNDFAHKLDASINAHSMTNLYNTFGSTEKDHIQKTFHSIKSDHSETMDVKNFKQLSPLDQFKLMCTVLWTATKIAAKYASSQK